MYKSQKCVCIDHSQSSKEDNMLLDCLFTENRRSSRANKSKNNNKQITRNSVQPTMSTSDTPHPLSTTTTTCIHSLLEEDKARLNLERQNSSVYTNGCDAEKQLRRTGTSTSIEAMCYATASATPILFFSDGSPRRVHSWSESLDKLLQDPVGIQNFFIHLKTEHSTENIRFWLACENYIKITSPEQQSEKAHQIYNEFLSRRAANQVNVNCSFIKEVRKGMSKPNVTTFQKVQYEIFQLMRTDSYPRFLKSERYLMLLKDEDPSAVPRRQSKLKKNREVVTT